MINIDHAEAPRPSRQHTVTSTNSLSARGTVTEASWALLNLLLADGDDIDLKGIELRNRKRTIQ
jgi:hypothetical protein